MTGKPEVGELHKAVKAGDVAAVADLLKRGADVDEVDCNGWHVRDMAVCLGNVEIVRLFIARGVDINLPNFEGTTMLMNAAMGGFVEIAQLLLDNGAEVDTVNPNGWAALGYCVATNMREVYEDKVKIMRLLLERGADMDGVDDQGLTVLYFAKSLKKHEMVELLQETAACRVWLRVEAEEKARVAKEAQLKAAHDAASGSAQLINATAPVYTIRRRPQV